MVSAVTRPLNSTRAVVLLMTAGVLSTTAFWLFVRPAVFDDAFISFRYAKNLAEGHGLVYNVGERVEGFTNLFWTLLAAVALRVGFDPLRASRIVGLVCLLATAGAVLWIWLRAQEGNPRLLWSGALLCLLVTGPYGMTALAVSGLETSLVALMAVLLPILFFFPTAERSMGRDIAGSVAALTATATRLDTALIPTTALLLDVLLLLIASPRSSRLETKRLLVRHAGWIAGTIAITVGRWAYYGDLLPNSYYAKAADVSHWRAGVVYLGGFVRNSPYVLVLCGCVIGTVVLWWRSPFRLFMLQGMISFGLFCIYVAKVGGDFMYYRFMAEILPVLIAGAVIAFMLIERARPSAARALALGCLVLGAAPPYLERSYGMQSLGEMTISYRVGRVVGERLQAALPRDTVISTSLAGTMAYFSDLRVVDELGLNDRYTARLPTPPLFARGHVKHAPIDYLALQDVNLQFGHPTICSCSAPCTQRAPSVFIRLNGDECVGAAYLVQTPELTRYFCSQPATFVLQNVVCASLRQELRPLGGHTPGEGD